MYNRGMRVVNCRCVYIDWVFRCQLAPDHLADVGLFVKAGADQRQCPSQWPHNAVGEGCSSGVLVNIPEHLDSHLTSRQENYPTRLIFVASHCSGYSVCSPDRLRAITRRGYRNRMANENADDVVVATTHKENPYPHRWTPFYKQRTTDANEIMRIRGKQIMYERLLYAHR